MIRHLIAYIIVIGIYFLPGFLINPSGYLYFISAMSWSWISVVVYDRFIMLRVVTKLCVIELFMSVCAIIALTEYLIRINYKASINWHIYSNFELILDCLFCLELLLITRSLIGASIGILGNCRYNNFNRPHNTGRPHIG